MIVSAIDEWGLMYDRTLRNAVSLVFIGGHIALLIQLVYLHDCCNRFDFTEVLDAALIMTPMLGAYTSVVVRYVFFGATQGRGKQRSPTYVATTGLIMSAFFAALAWLALTKAKGTIDFEEYKRALAGVDTVFAFYLSQLIASLFEHSPRAEQAPQVALP